MIQRAHLHLVPSREMRHRLTFECRKWQQSQSWESAPLEDACKKLILRGLKILSGSPPDLVMAIIRRNLIGFNASIRCFRIMKLLDFSECFCIFEPQPLEFRT